MTSGTDVELKYGYEPTMRNAQIRSADWFHGAWLRLCWFPSKLPSLKVVLGYFATGYDPDAS